MLWPLFATGQNTDILIEKYNLEDGLSNSSVLDLHQDKYGFFWFATEHGLNRFDGKSFRGFRYNPDDPATIKANFIKRLYEDPSGNIWVLYGVGGMSKYDRAAGKFIYYTYDRSTPTHPNNHINSLFWDDKGLMWISTQNGINHLDEEKETYFKVALRASGLESEDLAVRFVCQDKAGRLWTMTSEGFCHLILPGYKLNRARTNEPGDNNFVKGRVWRINDINPGEFLIGSTTQGVLKYNPEDNHFEVQEFLVGESQNLYVTSLFRDVNGDLFAGLKGTGLFRYDPDDNIFLPVGNGHPDDFMFAFADSTGGIWSMDHRHHFFYQKGSDSIARPIYAFPKEEKPPVANALTVDEKGNIWVGTNSKGVLKFLTEKPHFNHISDFRSKSEINEVQPDPFVTALATGTDDLLWVGTKNGLKCYDKKEKQFLRLSKHFPALSEFENTGIRTLYLDSGNRLFVTSHEGLGIWDFGLPGLQRFSAKDQKYEKGKLSSNSISAILESGNDEYWIATDHGLNRFDLSKGSFSNYFHNAKIETSLSNHSVSCLLKHSDGTIWAGTIAGGLNRLEGWENDNPKFRHYFLKSEHENPTHKLMTVNVLFEDDQGGLWIGSYSRGLLKYDPVSDQLITIPTSDGLPIPNIAGILQDDNGYLWISSNDGIARYNPSENSFLHFDKDDGIQSLEFNARAYAMGEDGCLYFGGINGINEFHPGNIVMRPEPQKPLITGFELFGKARFFEKPIHEMDKIVLDYNQNFFAFNFISIDYDRPQKLHYSYYLENLETGWKRGGSPGEASYANLAPGEYVFHVKATNYEGRSSPAASMKVVINPPFWQRSWFILLAVIVFVLFLYGLHAFRVRLRLNKIKEIERIREKAAADFHDELGHRLTKISLFSEMILRTVKPEGDLAKYLEKIRENSNGLYHSMRDFIWAMNPKKDSIFELGLLLKDFGDELFDKTMINFRVHGIEEGQKQIKLNMDWKRHLVLMFKEAMHNTLKHAGCRNATLQITLAEKELVIELEDDGKGFVKDEKRNGYGIGNMYTRAKKLNGNLEIESLLDKGTRIRFTGVV